MSAFIYGTQHTNLRNMTSLMSYAAADESRIILMWFYLYTDE